MSNWEADPEPARGIIYPVWPGNASGSPRRNWRVWLGRRKPGGPCLSGCHRDPALDKRTRMDGWMDVLRGYSFIFLRWHYFTIVQYRNKVSRLHIPDGFVTIATHVANPQVVGHDQHEVRPGVHVGPGDVITAQHQHQQAQRTEQRAGAAEDEMTRWQRSQHVPSLT